ncbi:GntR family transcriptional regulator [Halolactibacillus miurensis]|uniref:GntR family transcriptional regulator n=1 Tax=Halolactibacillus miurensis TaxID=306541 RepID=A0A1I6R162_9BACI|nr:MULTISPECIES: GntR family transcriptional regulator [Halolactibacillus]GEM03684.1 GntR family transcriptional regulator [Halolactibacillus miurensis]SFS58258.1 GntR family transcriptional regulator [Halolactibacillus miurensis]
MTELFSEYQSIYRQIADKIKNQILKGDLKKGDKLPSLRAQAVELEVNINTITKGYNILENDGMIEKQRGLGFFVTEDAYVRALTERKQRFQEETLPKLKQELALLNLSEQALLQLLKQIK